MTAIRAGRRLRSGTIGGLGRYGRMPRFFFHVCNGNGLTEDEEGQELGDVEAARRRAVIEARDIMSHEMREGELNLASFIEVQNEAGEYLFTLPFSDAFKIVHHH